MINIVRKRFVVIRTEDNSIFCGLARQHHFVKLSEIKDVNIKTYCSEMKAKSSFILSWRGASKKDFEENKYKIVEIEESIKEVIV